MIRYKGLITLFRFPDGTNQFPDGNNVQLIVQLNNVLYVNF